MWKISTTAKENSVTGSVMSVSFSRKRMDSRRERRDSGRSLSHFSSRSANTCSPGRRGRRQRIGTRIATRTFCHVSPRVSRVVCMPLCILPVTQFVLNYISCEQECNRLVYQSAAFIEGYAHRFFIYDIRTHTH
jgi:hypothetical protein